MITPLHGHQQVFSVLVPLPILHIDYWSGNSDIFGKLPISVLLRVSFVHAFRKHRARIMSCWRWKIRVTHFGTIYQLIDKIWKCPVSLEIYTVPWLIGILQKEKQWNFTQDSVVLLHMFLCCHTIIAIIPNLNYFSADDWIFNKFIKKASVVSYRYTLYYIHYNVGHFSNQSRIL